ncbi:LiaI-LiaF-like domain-containing protein [Ottowia sp.]|uniref:LiaI-LiaF-like domain-containing protein n=1 Tax=Ottowia sp. TaxID=1898956 RepID=UPI0039E3B9BA
MRGNVGAIVLILVGAFFLLSNLGLLNVSLRELIATWWPLILIVLGVALFFTPGGRGRK